VLPLLGLGRVRRRIREGGWRMLVALLLLIGVAGLSSCGTASGFFNQSPQTYTVTLTATSGTAQHSTPISLTVE
jgi:ABC-type transporter Mla subunit MlaD